MNFTRYFLALALLAAALTGCGRRGDSTKLNFEMGEKVPSGPLIYNVIETVWRNQLGDGLQIRSPQNRFLLVSISVTNGGGDEVALPLFSIEDGTGKSYLELDNGTGVSNWFGLLRSIAPAQTQQGRLVFDVPLASYTIRLPNGGNPGEEKFVTVNIPLRIDTDTGVSGPTLPVTSR